MDEDAAHARFKELAWPENDGKPTCPKCRCPDAYAIKARSVKKDAAGNPMQSTDRRGNPLPPRLGNDGKILPHAARRWRCAACCKEFSVTSGTPFHSRKLQFKELLIAIWMFAGPAKGLAALKLCHDLDVEYKTAFVLEHKIREALLLEQRNQKLEGTVQIDGMYCGGYSKPANRLEDRRDMRLLQNQTGKRMCVVGAREAGPGGRTRVCVVTHERDAVTFVCDVTDRMAIVHADESASWDSLHGMFEMGRVNHSKEFWDDGVCTNQMESFFSRLRRFEVGTHHHIAGAYLLAYAADCSWREDHRRTKGDEKVPLMLGQVLKCGVSPVWKGYWQRRRDDPPRLDIWAHARDDSLASMMH